MGKKFIFTADGLEASSMQPKKQTEGIGTTDPKLLMEFHTLETFADLSVLPG